MTDLLDNEVRAKFEARVERRGPEDCWPWTGAAIKRGPRGFLYAKGKNVIAPRLSWGFANGQMPPADKFVCHSCDNPLCVNPAHLFLGTAKDNAIDRDRKGRGPNSKKTHCIRGHPLSGDNLGFQKGGRKCLECNKMLQARYRQKCRKALSIHEGKPDA